MGAVEPAQRLHGLDALELLVDVHRVQQRLVEAGLVLLRNNEDLVVIVKDLRGLAVGEAVEVALGALSAGRVVGVQHRAAERDEGADVGDLLAVEVAGRPAAVPPSESPGAHGARPMQPAGRPRGSTRIIRRKKSGTARRSVLQRRRQVVFR